jgi:CRISPR-associated endonuclease/helicase Cas3
MLARRAPHLPDAAATDRLWHRAFWSCWLHDLGKGAKGFQDILRDPKKKWSFRHEVLSLAFLPWVADENSEDFAWLAAAIASHHRDAPDLFERYRLDGPIADLDLEAAVAELADESILGVAGWLANTAGTWLSGTNLARLGVEANVLVPGDIDVARFRQEAPDAIVRGLTAYNELWKKQREESASPERRQGILLRGLVLLSDHLASGHADRATGQPINLEALSIPASDVLLGRVAGGNQLRSHQEGALNHRGSLVLAAPTGSGKTEAAVLWASHQLTDAEPAKKLLYLLPYQASLNAIRTRLHKLLDTDVGLLHGRAAQVLYRELAERPYSGVGEERAARRAVDLARLHQPAVWAATPYQLLSAAYRLRGYEQTWASLAQAVVVIDEPHAYEPIRLGMILGLLGELVRHWNVRVCAMTATMPTWLRQILEDSLQASSLPIDRDLFAAFRRHQLRLVEGEVVSPANLDRIAQLVREGKSVLVGVNTVARAQQVRQLLLERLSPETVWLLHSRFTGRDRLKKEQAIQARLQAGADQTAASGLAVVATQVIEVSLDLDFDTIFSEPAPLEALAQRFGRVNRRGKKGVVPVHVFKAPMDGQGIYDDELVRRTLGTLSDLIDKVLDEAVLGDTLDAIYGEDLAGTFSSKVVLARQEFEGSCLRTLHAFESDDGLEQVFDSLFNGTEVLPLALEAEYRQLADRSVLEAQSLLVPISDKQRYRLGERAEKRQDLKLWVVDVPYDAELGLLLNG